MEGGNDKRCVHDHMLKWINTTRPRIILMEIVAALARLHKFKVLFDSVLTRLRRMKDNDGTPCYQVFHKVLGSRGGCHSVGPGCMWWPYA